MAMVNSKKLERELFAVREGIKNAARDRGERAPAVCPDDAIYQMTELTPRKKEDFLSISGLGNSFIDTYAEYFLPVILKHVDAPSEMAVEMDAKAEARLKELEKKLVEVNRKNCLLYLGKLPAKRGVDLYEAECKDPMDILFKDQPVKVCTLDVSDVILNRGSVVPPSDDAAAHRTGNAYYRKYTSLLREINKDIRDKGQNDLYIGYPFVKGRISEDFDIRCPLVLFPVTADRTTNSVSLMLDNSRDVLFNNTLLLAYWKFNRIDRELPNDVFDEFTRADFMDKVLDFYRQHGIGIKSSDEPLMKFKEYSGGSFPDYESGTLEVENCAVLGKFPIRSSMLQRDFDEILEQKSINSLLNVLLQEAEDQDYYKENSYTEELKESGQLQDISEHDLVYINDLNSSQESVIAGIEHNDSLVVQGPPGTGKSQVITSLIADYVSKGKNVLMVSEKKTALDVVYSRLGLLSQFSLLIDDVGNKDLFYQQLIQMLQSGFANDENEIDIDSVSEAIDENIRKLERIAEKLYTVSPFGVEPYKVYQRAKPHDPEDEAGNEKLEGIRNCTDAELYQMEYPRLDGLHGTFTDEEQDRKFAAYVDIDTREPWMRWMKEDLSQLDLVKLTERLKAYQKATDALKHQWFLSRLLAKRTMKKATATIVSEYFDSHAQEVLAELKKDAEMIQASVARYEEFRQTTGKYNDLTEEQKNYFQSVKTCREQSGDSFTQSNDAILDTVLYSHIREFEDANEELLQDISEYGRIIDRLSKLIAEKKELTRRKVLRILVESLGTIQETKHHGEIGRILENKRKPSVNKFIERFGFELFKSVKIWLLTPEVVSELLPLEIGLFDLVVFDEASQMYVEKGVPSILRAKKVVIAGDHKQLRPSSLGSGRTDISEDLPEETDVTAALEEESLLDLARFKYRDTMLNFHYRSKYEELIAFSNYAFYHGKLHVSPNMAPPLSPPIEVHRLEDGIWEDKANAAEAKHVVALLKQFFRERTHDETIGVITFNVTQRDLIDDLIDEECTLDPEFAEQVRNETERKHDGEDIGLFVKNIESVQGDERDVIIFSIGYARNEEGKIVRQWGWLNQRGGENRLNVAISRAKEKVYIVTSIFPEELLTETAKNNGPKYLKKYMQYAFAVSSSDKDAARDILMSFGDSAAQQTVQSAEDTFAEQLAAALKERGYDVETNVGIGGYSIDLAVKKEGQNVLGIECDGKLYQSSSSARERDYHRQKYLESRGWKIHRIWSTSWWKDPEGELNKICKAVDSCRIIRRTRSTVTGEEDGQEKKGRGKKGKKNEEAVSNIIREGFILERNGRAENIDITNIGRTYKLMNDTGGVLKIQIVKPNGKYYSVDRKLERYFIEEVNDSRAGKSLEDGTQLLSLNAPLAKILANAKSGNLVKFELDGEMVKYRLQDK